MEAYLAILLLYCTCSAGE